VARQPVPTPIFENAVDSLRHGAAHYLLRDENPTAIKHAILLVQHSIELFLKESLARAHPVLVYQDLDKSISDNSRTVGLLEAVQRLENVGKALSADQVRDLRELRNRRNRIEHYVFDPSDDHVPVVGRSIKFLLHFLPQHLGVELRDLFDEDEDYRDLLEAALTYQERLNEANRQVAALKLPAQTCPQCCEDALVVDSPHGDYCFLCQEEVPTSECEGCGDLWPDAELERGGICPVCYANLMQGLD